MIELFKPVDDGVAILRSRGVFRQAKLFSRAGVLYAGLGSGFVQLRVGGGTTRPDISWLDLEVPGGWTSERIGPLTLLR